MINSFLITNIKSVQTHYQETVQLSNGLKFMYSLGKDNYYYNEKEKCGVFVFGYWLPRLSVVNKKIDLLYILTQLNSERDSLFSEIKGTFTLIHVHNGQLNIYNDHLGVSKFFYCENSKEISISNSIHSLLKIGLKKSLNIDSLSEYYIFNYLLNGRTFYKNIFYSTPSKKLSVVENKLIHKQYFDIISFISEGRKKLKGSKVFSLISTKFIEIVEQYAKSSETKLSLTLTAGLDSRIILGGLKSSVHINFESFTFGKAESYDVEFAKVIASKSGVSHKHLYPPKGFFENFNNIADETFHLGETMVSIYRSHRLDAYKNVAKNSESIIMGLAGSDLVRGIFFDSLIVSPIAHHCWNKRSFESFFANNHIKEKYKDIIEINDSFLIDNKESYKFIKNPLEYLFSVVVPLHFSQDIMLNQKIGIKTFIPFLDLDYLELLRETEYFNLNDYRNFKLYSTKRRIKGLVYSAKLSNTINKDLSEYSLGKGYTPKDIITGLPVMYYKNWEFKKRNKKMFQVANFDYGEWYWNFINQYFKNNDFDFLIDKSKILNRLQKSSHKGGELYFLDFTKAINIQKAIKLIE